MVNGRSTQRITIVGAGQAGIAIASEIRAKGIFGRVVAFLDDDPDKIGRRIQGIPIMGPIAEVVAVLNATPDDEAIIAIPAATREQLRTHLRPAAPAPISPASASSRASRRSSTATPTSSQPARSTPRTCCRRDPVTVSLRESLAYLRGKRVLITGAGGSIGSELARQLLSGGAQRLYLFGHGENSIYEIDRELRLLQKEGVGEAATIVPVIGELQDRDYVALPHEPPAGRHRLPHRGPQARAADGGQPGRGRQEQRLRHPQPDRGQPASPGVQTLRADLHGQGGGARPASTAPPSCIAEELVLRERARRPPAFSWCASATCSARAAASCRCSRSRSARAARSPSPTPSDAATS